MTKVSERIDALSGCRRRANLVLNLTPTNQADDDTGSDDEGQQETIRPIPLWSPASRHSRTVHGIKSVKGKELDDERVLNRHEGGRPGYGRRKDSDHIPLVALTTTVAGPLQSPVDCSEAR